MYATLMMLWLALADPAGGKAPPRRRPAFRRSPQRPLRRRLELELLEDRSLLSGVTLGPLIDLSDPDVLAACGSNGAEKESYIAVNPANPNNIVVTWFGGGALGTVTAVSLDGGSNWQQVIVPGATQCTGGSPEFQNVADPWLSFAPNGDLYHSSISFNIASGGGVFVSKSVDGGLDWTSRVLLEESTDNHTGLDKDSVTADPTHSRFAYAVWTQDHIGGSNPYYNINHGVLRFSRTTDGGATWEPARTIFDPGSNNRAIDAQVVVMPDGTLAAVFVDLLFTNPNGSGQKVAVLSVIHSTDQGQTWSAPIQGPTLPSFQITDPENGVPIANMASYPVFFAPVAIDRSGNLYVVFEDNRFSGGQSSSIAFTMSPDGGRTWSKPIAVNQTPTNIPVANRNAFLPSVAVAADGTIGVTYYDLRFNDPNPGLPTDYWLVQCHPSATAPATDPANWGSEVRLTNSSFNLEGAPRPAINGGAYFLGDYEGLTTVGNDFLAAWGQPHDTDPDSVYFRDPPAVQPNIPSVTDSATGGAGLAADAYFLDPARTSQTTSSVPNGDTAPAHSFGTVPPPQSGGTDQVVPPPAPMSGMPTSALARRAAHAPADEWGTDVLTSADPSWDVEAAAWPAS
jgi:hypothetical protein